MKQHLYNRSLPSQTPSLGLPHILTRSCHVLCNGHTCSIVMHCYLWKKTFSYWSYGRNKEGRTKAASFYEWGNKHISRDWWNEPSACEKKTISPVNPPVPHVINILEARDLEEGTFPRHSTAKRALILAYLEARINLSVGRSVWRSVCQPVCLSWFLLMAIGLDSMLISEHWLNIYFI